MLTILNQTRTGKIFKCTIFVGYGGVIFFTGVAPLSPTHSTVVYNLHVHEHADIPNVDTMVSRPTGF